ncbi:MAG: hypothetical protein AAFO58_12675, partial [Pseudomonadota bacterium]
PKPQTPNPKPQTPSSNDKTSANIKTQKPYWKKKRFSKILYIKFVFRNYNKMKISSILMAFLMALMVVDFSTAWHCRRPRKHHRRRRCPWGGWGHYGRRRWCGRNYRRSVDVKKYTNAIRGHVIGSQINMKNGGKHNKQTNVKVCGHH